MQNKQKQVRKCIVTGENFLKSEMIRLVSFRGGNIEIDLKGKKDGRGCYISLRNENIEKLCKNNASLLARVFRRKITDKELKYLEEDLPKAFEEKLFRAKETKKVILRIKKTGEKIVI